MRGTSTPSTPQQISSPLPAESVPVPRDRLETTGPLPAANASPTSQSHASQSHGHASQSHGHASQSHGHASQSHGHASQSHASNVHASQSHTSNASQSHASQSHAYRPHASQTSHASQSQASHASHASQSQASQTSHASLPRTSHASQSQSHASASSSLLTARSGVFIAYSHRDRDLLGELQRHLKPLQKAWMLDLWDDLRVDTGPRGAADLQRAIDSARVALLLISPGFLASPFVAEHALPILLAAQPHPRAAVMCLYLRPAMEVFAEYKFRDPSTRSERHVRITNFHALNDPTCPLASQQKPARAGILAAAAEEIIAAAHRGNSAPSASASFSEL